MTTEDSGRDGEVTAAREALADGLRDVATAEDAAGVVASGASAFGALFETRAECAVYLAGDGGDAVSLAAASEGADPPPEDALGDAVAAGESARVGRGVDGDEREGWSLLIPVPGDGVVVVQADECAAKPAQSDVRTLATAVHQRVRDLTTIASLTDEVASLEADNEQLTEFASIVAHDLRNPLAVARGRLELAVETGDEEHFEQIETAHERIESIIDHTLTLAKDGSSENQLQVDLETMADMAWSTADTGDGSLDITSTTRLTADDERLKQLLENLFRNAVEHSSTSPRSSKSHEDAVEHAETTSEADEDAEPVTVRVGTIEDDGAVEGFYVEDDGPGIPEADRETVFEHGYTTNPDGTGYGLAIVEDIANDHGWAVSVTEGEAGGARFEFTGVE